LSDVDLLMKKVYDISMNDRQCQPCHPGRSEESYRHSPQLAQYVREYNTGTEIKRMTGAGE
jgi:hypothetical protein